MGKISPPETRKESFNHFTHPHPLKLLNYQPQQTLTIQASSCSGCKLKTSGLIYSCTTCNYFLRKKCFEMPKKITHPFTFFTLLRELAHAEGLFNCDACGQTGNGFSYHCKPCGIYLHILCAIKQFRGFNHWLYRCDLCEFDAHMNCARGVSVRAPLQPNFNAFQSQWPMAAASSRSAPQQNFVSRPMVSNAAVGIPASSSVMSPFGINRQNHELLLQALNRIYNNNHHAIAQGTMAGGAAGAAGAGVGGSGGRLGGLGSGFGEDRELQQWMHLISGHNNGGLGGGGQNFQQALLNGGGEIGGGGLDLMQSLLGGGDGLDFLGGAFGGFSF
ncbi:hypothetical protein Pfo_005609 [Paulownia fortunei]|nr:hypothetical protein Pfo_005609 [Paulownia fortunei]